MVKNEQLEVNIQKCPSNIKFNRKKIPTKKKKSRKDGKGISSHHPNYLISTKVKVPSLLTSYPSFLTSLIILGGAYLAGNSYAFYANQRPRKVSTKRSEK